MYQYVWNKFLPVIALKLKAAVKKREPQQLEIDKLDFERASDKKNAKYQFKLEMNEGRSLRSKDNSAIALDFARALNEYEITKEIIKTGSFKFSMNTKFVLSIEANLPPLASVAVAGEVSAEAPSEVPSDTLSEAPSESSSESSSEASSEAPTEASAASSAQ
jgi:hypothetical protein